MFAKYKETLWAENVNNQENVQVLNGGNSRMEVNKLKTILQ